MSKALTMSLPQPNGAFDWAAVVSLLGVVGAAIAWLWRQAQHLGAAQQPREDGITAREERYMNKVEGRLREMDDRLAKMESAFGLVVGVAHVMVDDLIVIKPQSLSLRLVAGRIRAAYPKSDDMPGEIIHLLHRLDLHLGATDIHNSTAPQTGE